MIRQKEVFIIALLASGLAVAAWFLLQSSKETIYDLLKNNGLESPFQSFMITQEKSLPVKSFVVTEATGRNGDSEIQVSLIPNARESYSNYVEQRFFQIQSQFNRGASPYPGTISQHTECPADFLPVTEKVSGAGWSGQWLRTFANSRKQFGVCNKTERHFDVATLILLCAESGTVFDLTIFAGPDGKNLIERVKSVVCDSTMGDRK